MNTASHRRVGGVILAASLLGLVLVTCCFPSLQMEVDQPVTAKDSSGFFISTGFSFVVGIGWPDYLFLASGLFGLYLLLRPPPIGKLPPALPPR